MTCPFANQSFWTFLVLLLCGGFELRRQLTLKQWFDQEHFVCPWLIITCWPSISWSISINLFISLENLVNLFRLINTHPPGRWLYQWIFIIFGYILKECQNGHLTELVRLSNNLLSYLVYPIPNQCVYANTVLCFTSDKTLVPLSAVNSPIVPIVHTWLHMKYELWSVGNISPTITLYIIKLWKGYNYIILPYVKYNKSIIWPNIKTFINSVAQLVLWIHTSCQPGRLHT